MNELRKSQIINELRKSHEEKIAQLRENYLKARRKYESTAPPSDLLHEKYLKARRKYRVGKAFLKDFDEGNL